MNVVGLKCTRKTQRQKRSTLTSITEVPISEGHASSRNDLMIHNDLSYHPYIERTVAFVIISARTENLRKSMVLRSNVFLFVQKSVLK